jgi:hypothetical protein
MFRREIEMLGENIYLMQFSRNKSQVSLQEFNQGLRIMEELLIHRMIQLKFIVRK